MIPQFAPDIIEKNNEHLQDLYDKIELELGKDVFFEFEPNLMKATTHHKWGPAPFHYQDGFYLKLIEKIKSVSLTSD